MTNSLAVTHLQPARLLIPWRDPHTVSPARLGEHIAALEQACREQPRSADLRTVLGMAYAMNYDVYRSMDALEEAVRLDGSHFFAQFKYAELLYRIRTLRRAEEETLKALELADNTWQLSMARAQLKDIRHMLRKGHERPALTRAFASPPLVAVLASVVIGLALLLR
jgi:tetratricopeptide (TPR) repeat protein